VERYNYGKVFTKEITPPNLKSAYYTDATRDEITLEFDQPVVWKDSLTSQFYLDAGAGKIASGAASGNMLKLKITASSKSETITYLDSKSWSQNTLLQGKNGIAALTFCKVPILTSRN